MSRRTSSVKKKDNSAKVVLQQSAEIEVLIAQGLALHQQGSLNEAQAIYQDILNRQKDHFDALQLLGALFLATKQYQAAVDLLSKALEHNPYHVSSYSNRGIAFRNLKQYDAALADYTKAIELKPDYAQAYSNRGNVFRHNGQYDAALADFDKAIRLNSDYAEGYSNRGKLLTELKQYDAALADFNKAICLKSDYAEAYSNRGILFQLLQQYDASLADCTKALSLQPELAKAHNGIGAIYRLRSNYIEALHAIQTAVQIDPQHAPALQNYATILAYLSNYTDVCQYSDQALRFASRDDITFIWESRLYAYIYHPDLTAHQIVQEHIKWGSQFAALGRGGFAKHDRTPHRRLKVGYVSPDFRAHTCRFYFDPLFSNHNHTDFELFAYSNVLLEDEHTQRMKPYFDQWRSIVGISDEVAAQMIRDDQIDILVDGCGHMMDTRLEVFAHKPAPIQVTWLGSAWTTGLPQMDYVLFDPHMAPQGTLASEQIVRLPRTWAAFRPGEQAIRTLVNPLPAAGSGQITFGYSGRPERLNHRVFKVWGRILKRLPQARLILDYKAFADPKTAAYYQEFLQSHGVDTSRVVMRYSSNIFIGLAEVDILLDSFPHSGGTMLFDAVWMGVPAVTLAGDRPVGRIGTSLMTNLGLAQWVAKDEQEYEDKAVSFAQDIPTLVNLRMGMRERMQSCAVMDETAFARDVEQAFKIMWQTWLGNTEALLEKW